MTRVPLLSGSRLTIVNAGDGAEILRPPAPAQAIDVAAAVREALRFPLSGPSLETVARGATRATIVVEPPGLPLPGSPSDPRREAIAATVSELERCGIATGYQTLLVAGGLARRLAQRDLAELVSPEFARRFHGHVEVHDAEAENLVELGSSGSVELRAHPSLVETDLVVTVTAAETVLNGGPSALLGAANASALRCAGAYSLLETAASQGWRLAVALERALADRVPVLGVSLVLNHPRFGGALRGYPYEPAALERIARSPLRPAFAALPSGIRQRVLSSLPAELSAAAAFAGSPSVAHAEAMLRSIELRSADLEGPVDAIVIGIPRATPYLPREQPNPLLAAYLGLGHALRLWRDSFPVVAGGTAILVHHFHRHFAHPTQQPYRAIFAGARFGHEELAAAERAATDDLRAIEAYRAGRACHPLLPFRDWEACQPAIDRLGAVLIAGCRDATAARQLGFVPTHGVGAALGMARGRADSPPRIGFLLSPPYFGLRMRGGG